MAREKPFPSGRGKPFVNLDHVDTSETAHGVRSDDIPTGEYTESFEVPPFRGQPSDSFVKRSEISLTWKVGAVIATVFIVVGVPVIIFSANINSSVNNLQSDVKEIKSKTDSLVEGSIKQGIRIDVMEKSLIDMNQHFRSGKNLRQESK